MNDLSFNHPEMTEAERCRQELSAFAYRVSHDLQAPLRNIAGFTTILEKSLAGRLNEEQQEEFDFIRKSARQAQSLLESLLHYSRLSSELYTLEPLDTGRLINMVLQRMQPQLMERGAEVTFEALPTVQGNEALVVRLFEALIDNASKFHAAGGNPRVRISGKVIADEVAITVEDNGIGIPPKSHERIFELFRRLHGEGQYSGIGAGLAFAKKIAELHGGRITVESEQDKGARVTVWLPKAK